MRPDEPCVHERDATGPLARFFYNTGLPCVECEREAHDAWIETVRAKLTAGLEAAARGERYDWSPAEPLPATSHPEPAPAAEAFVLEPRPQPEPWTLERITAFLAEHERSKRVLACAPDVYRRVRDQVEASGLGVFFRVVEQPLLPDGQVLSIDPAALEPPPFELPADWRAQIPLPELPRPDPRTRALPALRTVRESDAVQNHTHAHHHGTDAMTDVFADEEGIGRLTCPACGNHLFEILQAFRGGQPCPRCDLPADAARQVLEAQRKGADAELLGKYQEAMKRALEAERECEELRARMREVREVANRPMPGY